MQASTVLAMVDHLPNNHLLMASRWGAAQENWDSLSLPTSLHAMKRMVQLKGKKGTHFWVLKWTADHEAFSNPKLLDELFFVISFMLGKPKPMVGTVLAELTNNAIDHGLLHMSSSLKKDHEGMVAYFEERMKKLHAVTQKKLYFCFYCFTEGMTKRLVLSCEDTGEGFSIGGRAAPTQEQIKDRETAKYYGRGLSLMQAIASDFHTDKEGRRNTLVMDLD